MARITAINKTHHRDIKIRRDKVEAQSANSHMIPVVVSEFLKAATQYPIVFTKNRETGKFACVALCGFEPGENLFWRNGEWDGIYVPLNVARQPFFIGSDDANGSAFVLCIDVESECIDQTEGEALFDAQGDETEYLQSVQAIMGQLVDGESQTGKFTEKLIEYELLTELSLDIKFDNDDKQKIQGIYTVNEEKLNAIAHDALAALHTAGYLPWIYAMVVSLGHIYGLVHRKNTALAKAQQWYQADGEQ
ncbi:hypothetical protein MNBD_ALPHA05-121 [hydrothermal vent metagenome]|uniref:Peptide transport system permease protein sapC (TC 3.A.1.5.5) n=1 Tax=hydrothermal vent metagenome TaxID=652676 RepID=A0A3B0T1Y6_9ZZZZ